MFNKRGKKAKWSKNKKNREDPLETHIKKQHCIAIKDGVNSKRKTEKERHRAIQDIHQQRVESSTASGIAASNTRSSSAWQDNREEGQKGRKRERGKTRAAVPWYHY